MSLNEIIKLANSINISSSTISNWNKRGLINTDYEYTPQQLKHLNDKLHGTVRDQLTILSSEKSELTSIELFSGCGGMAIGLENAGFQHQLLVEIDQYAIATLKHNRPQWTVLDEDIKTVDFKSYQNKIDLVAGGFPCQSFSYAGNRAGMDDIRGTLFFEFARCVQEIRPRIALAENVKGLLNHDDGKTLQTMIKVLESLGYNVYHRIYRSQFMNVPQKRERLFIVAVRNDIKPIFSFPEEGGMITTLREALIDCPSSPGAKYPANKQKVMEHIPEGGNWRDLPGDLKSEYMKGSLKLSGGKTGMARRLSWNEPSLTLTCSPSQNQTERCHPTETRPLTVREYARIQTFPDNWEFMGGVNAQYKQIGNAVPVNLAFHIGKSLINFLNIKNSND